MIKKLQFVKMLLCALRGHQVELHLKLPSRRVEQAQG
jgi:hypothetical protein